MSGIFCPICHNKNLVKLTDREPLDALYRCDVCGHVFLGYEFLKLVPPPPKLFPSMPQITQHIEPPAVKPRLPFENGLPPSIREEFHKEVEKRMNQLRRLL